MCDVHSEINVTHDMSGNMREQKVKLYLKQKGIMAIVDSLLGELLVRRPHDPYEYLIQLLDKRILIRDGLIKSLPPFSSQDIIKQAKQSDLPVISKLKENRGNS
ncbi:hypothetical protein P5V15_010355 [Pogonomyrmex californicus]